MHRATGVGVDDPPGHDGVGVGVLVVGTLTVFDTGDFPDDTVWSAYGRGYGFIPLVLPFIGLWWLRHTGRR